MKAFKLTIFLVENDGKVWIKCKNSLGESLETLADSPVEGFYNLARMFRAMPDNIITREIANAVQE